MNPSRSMNMGTWSSVDWGDDSADLPTLTKEIFKLNDGTSSQEKPINDKKQEVKQDNILLQAFSQFSLVPLVAESSPKKLRTRQPRSGLRNSISTSDGREKRKEFMLRDVDDELEVAFTTRRCPTRSQSVRTLDVREQDNIILEAIKDKKARSEAKQYLVRSILSILVGSIGG